MIFIDQDSAGSATIELRGSRLEHHRFDEYRRAVEGARFDAKRKVQVAQLDQLPRIIERLREACFEAEISDGLRESLKRLRLQTWYDQKAAGHRANVLNDALQKRGLALYPFQRRGLEWLSSRHGALLADEMGLGKTIQTIAAIPPKSRVVVVAPAAVKGVWLREMAKWRPDFRVSVLSGRGSFRFPREGEMLVTNYEILPPCHVETCDGKMPRLPCPGCATEWTPYGIEVKAPGHNKQCDGFRKHQERCPGCAKYLRLVPEGMVVIADEAHALKNPKAQRTDRFRALAGSVRDMGGRVWLLTATPLLNHPPELWSVLAAARLAQEAFGSWKMFTSLFDATPKFHGGYSWKSPHDEVTDRLKRVSLVRKRQEVLPDLPVKTWEDLEVDIDKRTLKACDALVTKKGGVEKVIAEMMQGVKFETFSKVRAALAEAKTATLLPLIEEFEESGDPLVVFSAHRFPVDVLGQRKGWRTITGDIDAATRTEIEESFQRGELRGVAATIQAGGTGITLTRAFRAIFVDRAFTPALNAQAEDRVCRIGQTRGVIITNLVANHALDKRLAELLTSKSELIRDVVDASKDGGNS